MASKIQVQPGFLPPTDDVMSLVNEVGSALRTILKNEQDGAGKPLAKSEGEHVATSDPQTIKAGGDKGAPHVKTADPQVGLGKAEVSGAESSGSGGAMLPVKKGEDSPGGSPSASPSASAGGEGSAGGPPGGSPSASAGGEGSPSGAPPAEGAPGAGPGPEAPAAGPSFEELVQMYSALSPEDLQAHMAAIEQAAQAAAGAAPGAPGAMPPGGAPPAGGPGAMPPGGAPSAPPSPAPSAPSAPPAGAPPDPMLGKSEGTVLAELKKTQADLAAVAEAVTALVTMPKRKAVNGLSIIPMQKSEAPVSTKPSFEDLKKNPAALHVELRKMTLPDSGMQKSERDIVTDFYCGRVNVDALAPLFKK